MKPNKLIMSAFGPYSGKTEINFDDLGSNGLYLITGDTGAGKSTIFDAIVYALYGETSVDKRKPDMLRSKYADVSTATYVQMEFTVKGKKYKIKRNPHYIRPSLKGKGLTEQKAEVELLLDDGYVLTKTAEVDQKIEEIMGINRNQFLQIAMIAQGDFMKLLLASTKERGEIFRKIFKTEKFYKIEEQLKAQEKTLKLKCEQKLQGIEIYLNNVKADQEIEGSEQFIFALKQNYPITEIVELLQRLIVAYSDKEKELDEQIFIIEEKINKKVKIINDYYENQKAITTLAEKERLLEETEKNLSVLKEKTGIHEQLNQDVEEYSENVARLNLSLPKYKELEDLSILIADLSKKINQLKLDKEQTDAKINESKDQLDNVEKQLKELSDSGRKAQEYKNEGEKICNSIRTLTKILDRLKEKVNEEDNLLKYQADYLEKKQEYIEVNNQYQSAYKTFLDAQAGLIAHGLVEGEACPVCGSKTHPVLAVKPQNAPTQEQLNALQEKMDSVKNQCDESASLCSAITTKIKTLIADIVADAKEYFGELITIETLQKRLDDEILALTLKAQNYKKLYDNALMESKLYEQYVLSKPTLLEKVEGLSKKYNEIISTFASCEASLNEKASLYQSLKTQLPYESKEKAQRVRDNFENAKNSLQLRIKTENQSLVNCQNEFFALKSSIESLKGVVKQGSDLDVELEEDSLKELKSSHAQLKAKRDNVITSKTSNVNSYENIIKSQGELAQLEQEYATIKSLSDTASGSLSSKLKIRFETYVQTTYFDMILNRANVRLLIMSNGQYELIRRNDVDDISGRGLELDVIDHHNGSIRDVKTLSGGESFIASLSLALGLSDQVQLSVGGVQLDTMFVDEGFGSLDGDVLELVMQALVSIANDDKLVGIISHVSELKQRIDRQIVVKKTINGSEVSLI